MSQRLKPAVPTISKALGISTSSAKRLIADGLIPVVRVGRQLRIDELRLARWIDDGGAGGFKRRPTAHGRFEQELIAGPDGQAA